MASTLSGTSRKDLKRPTRDSERSLRSKKRPSAWRRMRHSLPIFMHGKLPSRHQRCTVVCSTPRYSATSATFSKSFPRANPSSNSLRFYGRPRLPGRAVYPRFAATYISLPYSEYLCITIMASGNMEEGKDREPRRDRAKIRRRRLGSARIILAAPARWVRRRAVDTGLPVTRRNRRPRLRALRPQAGHDLLG